MTPAGKQGNGQTNAGTQASYAKAVWFQRTPRQLVLAVIACVVVLAECRLLRADQFLLLPSIDRLFSVPIVPIACIERKVEQVYRPHRDPDSSPAPFSAFPLPTCASSRRGDQATTATGGYHRTTRTVSSLD